MSRRLAIRDASIEAPAFSSQKGSALLVVVILLLLASLFLLFGLNVGRFEQKTSGNDLRSKIAQEVAEAGVAQGVEYFNANRSLMNAIDTNWIRCSSLADSTDFPCGAVTDSRRPSMYAFHTTGSSGTAFSHRLVPIGPPVFPTSGQVLASAGGFPVQQQVGAVLCRIKIPTSPTSPTQCATSDSEASTTWLLTVVSKGSLPGEGTSSTVTQTIGAYNIFAIGPSTPPLVAAGSVSVGGGLQIVTSPDAAGSGVPVSVWTRLSMEKNGTPNTCYLEEFLRQGGSSSGPQYYQDIMVCHTCTCPGDGSLSFPKSGLEACQGMDIVDIDGNEANSAGCPTEPNLDIKREEFPKDLFAFVFGTSAWRDVDRDGIAVGAPCTTAALDCHFGEQRIISACTYPEPGTGAVRTATLPQDTCFLLNIDKNMIHIGDGIDDAAECLALGPATSGLVWVHAQPLAGLPGYDCLTTLRNVDQLGTPNAPVGLIYDGVLTQVHFQMYGLLFVREPNASTTLDASTGGSAELGLNAGATIYGAAVVQGQITSGGGGTAAIVYNRDVLFRLTTGPDNYEPDALPGSWTDRLRY